MDAQCAPLVGWRRMVLVAGWIALIWLAMAVAITVIGPSGEPEPASAAMSSVATSMLPGCILLSASDDPYGRRQGPHHPYGDYPIVVTLACVSFDDVETAAGLFPVMIGQQRESLAQGAANSY